MTGIAPPEPDRLRLRLIDRISGRLMGGKIALDYRAIGTAAVDVFAEWLADEDWGPIGGGHTMVPHYLAMLLEGENGHE